MRISEAMETTITTALSRGIIDEKLHAGPIACVRELASRADMLSENDNVTLPTMLKYLQSMGIVDVPAPKRQAKQKEEPEKPQSRLDAARGTRYRLAAG